MDVAVPQGEGKVLEKAFWEDFIQTEPWPIVRKPLVIAEVGVNHNGEVAIAKQLIDVAKQKGCGAVKFQKRTPELCVPPEQRGILRETPWGVISYGEYREKIEFGKAEYDEIDLYCKKVGMPWFASAWDLPSQQFLRSYDLPYNKIASPMLVHLELLHTVAAEGKLTFIAIGMSEYEQIDVAVDIFRGAGCPFILMHTVSEYPCGHEVLNLRQIVTCRDRYKVPIGYSGHEPTMLPGLLAVMMGAVAIERHITISRAMWGTDHPFSLEPRGVETLTNYIRQIPIILGSGERVVTEKEKANARKLRHFVSDPVSPAVPANGAKK
jgi:N-acetylneuraminate synthase